MATKFRREDARTCFRCHSDLPSFRLISLVKLPTENRTLEPDCLVELLCASCLRFEMDDLYEAFARSSIPVGVVESPDVCLSRQIGFAVGTLRTLPLVLILIGFGANSVGNTPFSEVHQPQAKSNQKHAY